MKKFLKLPGQSGANNSNHGNSEADLKHVIEEESRGSSSQQSLDERSRGTLPKLQLGFLELTSQEAPLSEAGRTSKQTAKSKKSASGSSQKLKRSKTKGF